LDERHRTGRVRGKELTAIRKSGEKFYVEFDSVILSEEPPRAFVIMRDITDRKKSEKALKERESLFRNVFRASATPLTISTVSDARYIDVNDAFTKMSGYTRDEVIGKTALDLNIWLNWENRQRLAKHMEAKGSLEDAQVLFRTKSGEIRTSLISAGYMEIAGQKCYIGSIKDITELKKSEMLIKKARKDLNCWQP
jgi:PAS domain S-box-containing protein